MDATDMQARAPRSRGRSVVELYNTIRPHWALRPAPNADPLTPHDVYANGAEVITPAWQHWARAAKKKLDQMMTADTRSQAA